MNLSSQPLSKWTPQKKSLILPIVKDKKTLKLYKDYLSASLYTCLESISKTSFKGKEHETTVVHGRSKDEPEHVILYGLGDYDDIKRDAICQMGGNVSRTLSKLKVEEVGLIWCDLPQECADVCQLFMEGFQMGRYKFDGYKTEEDDDSSDQTIKTMTTYCELVCESCSDSECCTEALKKGAIIGDAVNTARDLANTPANVMTPSEFVARAKKMPKKIKVQIIDEKKAKALKMGAFLAVGKGSKEPGYMVVMSYNGGKRGDKPVALVGKGVTFDTGGISIKPSKGMSGMKGDMSGAAAVFAAMTALAELKPTINVMAVMGVTENMPSSTAYKPGDVVTAMNGKTIEITNTDAEGRLVLADALSYVVSKGARKVVDIATLTGSCSVALGDCASAVLGNDQDLVDGLKDLSEDTGDRLWQLPLYDDYLDYLKSDVADLINANENRLAGTCTAAIFLEQFVDQTPWAHLDIASTMKHSKTKGYAVKGMSGSGVRNLIQFIMTES